MLTLDNQMSLPFQQNIYKLCSDFLSILVVTDDVNDNQYQLNKYIFQIIEDVRHTLTLGRKQILKCLLYVHKQFNNTESYYIHNSLYITDYCVWIQTVSDSTLRSLANKIKHCHLEKDDVLLNISTLELKFLQDLADSESSNSTSDSPSDTDSDDSSDNEIRPDAEQGNILDSAKPEIDTLQQQLSSLTMQGKQEKKTPSKPLIEIIDEKVDEPLTADND